LRRRPVATREIRVRCDANISRTLDQLAWPGLCIAPDNMAFFLSYRSNGTRFLQALHRSPMQPLGCFRNPRSALSHALSASLLLSVGLLGACSFAPATVMIDGVAVPRQKHRFEGNPYAVTHYDAHPKPQAVPADASVEGGRVSGVVCGLDVEYSVEHKSGEVKLSGAIENEHPANLRVLSAKDAHAVIGNIGPKEVRLEFSDQHVTGYVGRCPYRMVLDPSVSGGETLVEFITSKGQQMRVELYGSKSLWQMPPADQAAVLPLLLLCTTAKIFENLGRDSIPAYGFGGRLGAVPSGTLQLSGTIHRTDCGASQYQ
jgi:hypothetical protein